MGTKSTLMLVARALDGTAVDFKSNVLFASTTLTDAMRDLGVRSYSQIAVVTSTARTDTPQIQRDLVGAVSVASTDAHTFKADTYYNVDGYRVDDGRFTSFAKDVQRLIPASRVFTDPVRTFAYGTDASFYRLNPKMVIKVHNEEEMTRLLPLALRHQVPVTFRAAGTSLSGQALTDSVLLKISHTGKNFRGYEIHVILPSLLCCDCVAFVDWVPSDPISYDWTHGSMHVDRQQLCTLPKWRGCFTS
jgi:hypothetical protein